MCNRCLGVFGAFGALTHFVAECTLRAYGRWGYSGLLAVYSCKYPLPFLTNRLFICTHMWCFCFRAEDNSLHIIVFLFPKLVEIFRKNSICTNDNALHEGSATVGEIAKLLLNNVIDNRNLNSWCHYGKFNLELSVHHS